MEGGANRHDAKGGKKRAPLRKWWRRASVPALRSCRHGGLHPPKNLALPLPKCENEGQPVRSWPRSLGVERVRVRPPPGARSPRLNESKPGETGLREQPAGERHPQQRQLGRPSRVSGQPQTTRTRSARALPATQLSTQRLLPRPRIFLAWERVGVRVHSWRRVWRSVCSCSPSPSPHPPLSRAEKTRGRGQNRFPRIFARRDDCAIQ